MLINMGSLPRTSDYIPTRSKFTTVLILIDNKELWSHTTAQQNTAHNVPDFKPHQCASIKTSAALIKTMMHLKGLIVLNGAINLKLVRFTYCKSIYVWDI